jgi:hypothetical protein
LLYFHPIEREYCSIDTTECTTECTCFKFESCNEHCINTSNYAIQQSYPEQESSPYSIKHSANYNTYNNYGTILQVFFFYQNVCLCVLTEKYFAE